MNYRRKVRLLAAIPLLVMPLVAQHNERREGPEREFRAELRGRNEVPLTLSAARGTLSLRVNDSDTSVHFVLEYAGLLTPVTAAHIHVAQPDVNGGVTVFFCGTVPVGFPARLPCPLSGTVAGDFTAADVIGLTQQQLEVNNLPKLLAAIRAGKTYANVHTTTSPGGEIRGQIDADERAHVVNPRISISPASGPYGTNFTTSGAGFTRGGKVNITIAINQSAVPNGAGRGACLCDVASDGSVSVNWNTANLSTSGETGFFDAVMVDVSTGLVSNHARLTIQ